MEINVRQSKDISRPIFNCLNTILICEHFDLVLIKPNIMLYKRL